MRIYLQAFGQVLCSYEVYSAQNGPDLISEALIKKFYINIQVLETTLRELRFYFCSYCRAFSINMKVFDR